MKWYYTEKQHIVKFSMLIYFLNVDELLARFNYIKEVTLFYFASFLPLCPRCDLFTLPLSPGKEELKLTAYLAYADSLVQFTSSNAWANRKHSHRERDLEPESVSIAALSPMLYLFDDILKVSCHNCGSEDKRSKGKLWDPGRKLSRDTAIY